MLRYMLELFEFTLPSELRSAHVLLGHILRKALFELEEAPFWGERLVTSIQADQQEIGQHRQRDRAAHAVGLLRHWPLPQMKTALQLR